MCTNNKTIGGRLRLDSVEVTVMTLPRPTTMYHLNMYTYIRADRWRHVVVPSGNAATLSLRRLMRPLSSQPCPVHRDGTTWPTADGSQTVIADSLDEILGVLAVPPRGGCLQASLPHSSSRTRPLHGHYYPCRIPVKAVHMGPVRCGLEATPLFSSSLSTCWVQ